MRLIDLSDGKPALWKSDIYGDVAVHVEAMHNGIVKVTVDGGASARQVIDHPELLDGWFVIPARLHKRPSKPRKTGVGRVEVPAEVTNTIRDVPGVGKVAIVSEFVAPGTRRAVVTEAPKTTAQRNKRRLGHTAALNVARLMADQNPTQFQWEQASAVEEF